jgi:hypothetical protein
VRRFRANAGRYWRFHRAITRRRKLVAVGLAERVGFEPTARFPLASRSLSAIEPSLRLVSPENGHTAEDTQRLSAQWLSKISNLGHRDSPLEARSPPTAGFRATLWGKTLETGLAGWGGRNRTSEWRNQNPLPYRLATPQYLHWKMPRQFALRAVRTIAAAARPINARTGPIYGISAAFSGLR